MRGWGRGERGQSNVSAGSRAKRKKNVTPHPLSICRLGKQSCYAMDYKADTLFSSRVLGSASTWESLSFIAHVPLQITHQLDSLTMYIIPSSQVSSQLDGTLDLSHSCSWKPALACSKPHPCHWYQKHQSRANTMWCMTIMISDLAIFNFLLLYDVASEVLPMWLTPVYLLFAQVAVTGLHLSLADWTTSPLIDDSLLVCCCDSVLGVYTCTFLLFYLGI